MKWRTECKLQFLKQWIPQRNQITFLSMYGEDAKNTRNLCCELPYLLENLVEKGVRFVQLYHQGWDAAWQFAKRTLKICQNQRIRLPQHLLLGFETTRFVGRYFGYLGW